MAEPLPLGMSNYTIGEVADRIGFSGSASRYDEGRGLVVPSTRTEAGYGVYDDAAVARVAFVSRAKQSRQVAVTPSEPRSI